MVQELLNDIILYFEYLKSQGYYAAFHNLAIPMDSCMAKLAPYNINSNPFCLFIKSSSEAWNHCIERQPKVLAACEKGPFCGMCYAGMGEFVFPIRNKDGRPLAFLSISGFRLEEEQALKRIKAAAQTYGLSEKQAKASYYQDLKKDRPDLNSLSVLAAPLCRMFELLNLLLSDIPNVEVGNIAQNNIVSHAVIYLRRKYANPISSDDIARACHCSVSTLSHLFKQKMNLSIRQYIKNLRLSQAKRLLRDTELSVNAISDLLGYGNPNYFCNVFRWETGLSPTLFRKNSRTLPTKERS